MSIKEQFIINDESQLSLLAEEIIPKLNYKIVTFSGDMGAGKTTFIKYLCKSLGSDDVITSPTFSLVNEYHTSKGDKIYHFDFYRINKAEEALDMGLYEYLDSDSICLIEWPEKIHDLLDSNISRLNIKMNNTQRIITLQN